jgi:hypothetical protein
MGHACLTGFVAYNASIRRLGCAATISPPRCQRGQRIRSLSPSAQLVPDRAAGVVEQVKRLGSLRSEPAAIDHRYQAFREYRRGRDKFAVGRCVQSIRIARQRYSVGTFSCA